MIILHENDTLLFQGDSITHGGRVESDWDMNHVIGHGYQSILASKIGLENIERCPEILNRGVSGDSIDKMLARWNEDCVYLKPSVLSILIGINDCLAFENGDFEHSPEMFEKNYRSLLNLTVEKFPDIKLIIGEPFAFISPKALTDDNERQVVERRIKNCKLLSEYSRKIAADFNAVFVPFWGELKKYADKAPINHVMWDGIHPTYIGHEIMAEFWYDTVDKSGILAK